MAESRSNQSSQPMVEPPNSTCGGTDYVNRQYMARSGIL
jgi:hypothetical protein